MESSSSHLQPAASSSYDLSSVAKNKRGGVLVTDEEITAAFKFFDVDGTGKITTTNLRKRLGVFYKDMPEKDYRFLLNNKADFTEDDIRSLIANNEVTNFDPVAEAFKCFDPEGTGFVDHETLRALFQSLGFGEITDADLGILIETGDVDGDGRISLRDFRGMLDFNIEESSSLMRSSEKDSCLRQQARRETGSRRQRDDPRYMRSSRSGVGSPERIALKGTKESNKGPRKGATGSA